MWDATYAPRRKNGFNPTLPQPLCCLVLHQIYAVSPIYLCFYMQVELLRKVTQYAAPFYQVTCPCFFVTVSHGKTKFGKTLLGVAMFCPLQKRKGGGRGVGGKQGTGRLEKNEYLQRYRWFSRPVDFFLVGMRGKEVAAITAQHFVATDGIFFVFLPEFFVWF